MEDQNPWWFGEEHYKFGEWKNYGVKWIPELMEDIDSDGFALNFVVGPRQVGKTMLLLIFIHKELIGRVDPRAIFYFACDEISDYRELGEILDSYLSYRNSIGIRRSYIFLDEITYVEEWWRAIKARIDKGLFKNDSIYITGSASMEILKSRERFPGRRGQGKDIFVYPMSFSEYVKHFSKISIKTAKLSNIEAFERAMEHNKIFTKQLMDIFENYLITGGFPYSIREYLEKKRKPIEAQKIYLDWLKNDISKLGKKEKILKEVLSVILKAKLTPLSWNEIAKETSAGSPNTVREYVEALEDLFVAKILYIYEKRPRPRKNKKIHIIDPFLYQTLSRWTRTEITTDIIVESTVLGHVMRVADTYYWKNKTEVDIIAFIDNTPVGIEVKWGYKKWRKPPNLKRIYLLKRHQNPLFLASAQWKRINVYDQQ